MYTQLCWCFVTYVSPGSITLWANAMQHLPDVVSTITSPLAINLQIPRGVFSFVVFITNAQILPAVLYSALQLYYSICPVSLNVVYEVVHILVMS